MSAGNCPTKLYVQDARVWVPHADTVWEGGQLTADFRHGDRQLAVITDAGRESRVVPIRSEADLPPLRNPAILIGTNDLTTLSYLHEPDVLHNLEVRFCKRQTIYTYCGIVLVAINPYADLPLYGPGIIRSYRGHAMGDLEPHIFAVAEEAYARLERERCNLSIIVSGESGAGKTVSAKYAMRYFAAVGGSETETQIERKVLASSPIMEAIGNAKTTRNDNSSRFGKFTKLLFADGAEAMMALTGGSMQTYLLEKSRVVFQAAGERNYHVFYQLCAAREQWPELMLDHQDTFRFLNQGQSPEIARVSDKASFAETVTAFRTLGFSDAEVGEIIRLLAAILHLGNIEFVDPAKASTRDADQERCDVASDDPHLKLFADILQLDGDELRRWLTTRRIESIGDVVLIPMSRPDADGARNALAKHMYARLFQHVVNVINKSLGHSGSAAADSGTNSVASKKTAQNCFIGVLDIYGFETFETNSFEQFCINYANEKLQQQFNQHVFKLEQDEYLKEGIVWTMIDFYDNQPCIDMIESKLGILDLLDEECRMPGGSDQSWVGKLVEKCSKYPHFDKPRYGTVSFFVKHFSDTVQYESHGFLEKNRDTVSKELVNVLRDSRLMLCQKLMHMEDITDAAKESKSNTSLGGRVVISASKTLGSAGGRKRLIPSKQHKQTVGSQFRDSLSSLIATLHSTTPHYVRCIKPNDDKHAFKWDPPKIVQQLRACGVLETIRISAAGFPSRWQYDSFHARYQLLGRQSQVVEWDVKATCASIVRNWIHDEDKYRFGNSQIFFRAGQVAYLEQLRTDTRRAHVVAVQALVRRFLCQHRYQRLRHVVLGLQTHARGMLARQRVRAMREQQAAVTIQRFVRGWLRRRCYEHVRRAIVGLQRHARGRAARERFAQRLDNARALDIQRYCRGYLARVAFRQRLRSIVVCQSAVRRFLARRNYRRLRAEARTITHMQKMYKGLENKIISLQQRIDELNKTRAQLQKQNAEIPELRHRLEQQRALEVEVKQQRVLLAEGQAAQLELGRRLDAERDEKMAVLVERDREKKEWTAQRLTLAQQNEELRTQLGVMVEGAARNERVESESKSAQRVRKISEQDTQEMNQAYQRALRDKELTELENATLRQELARLVRLVPGGHSRSVSNASSCTNDNDDGGYASAKNTLELKKHAANGTMLTPPTAQLNSHNGSSEAQPNASDTSPDAFDRKVANSSTPKAQRSKAGELFLSIKLRRICEQEREKRQSLEALLDRYKSTGSINMEDSLRASELEVENDKMRKEYSLLRNSIRRGVESQELEAQHAALQEDLKRRRDECIQLRTILAKQSQSQSLHTLGSANVLLTDTHEGELVEALTAQKLVNRQLEAELTAVTEQSSAKLAELTEQIETVRAERERLTEILQHNVCESVQADESGDSNACTQHQSEQYLRHELQQTMETYVRMDEQLVGMQKKNTELAQRINILGQRLRDNGLDSSVHAPETAGELAVIKRMAQNYEGIFKYDNKNRQRMLQKLIVELTPRVAVTLLPALPAYIMFMCIRYTDLLNADNDVRALLTDLLKLIKKVHRKPYECGYRILWLVNCIKLHNLLKQYGGIAEYIKLNTEKQNQQQLKNFDLTEYRPVILDTIYGLYEKTVRQVQDALKPFIVPAILDHDEISPGRALSHSTTPAGDGRGRLGSPAPDSKRLVDRLDEFYKQFTYLGLDGAYIEQIFVQLMHHVCVIALNNLMLRQELCNWKSGMQIRYNVNSLEEWVRKKQMPTDVLRYLQPLIQVSTLLQSLPRLAPEGNVDSIVELCSSLTTAQVLKIMKSYTQDECENPIPLSLIEPLAKKLDERNQSTSNDDFTMEEGHVQAVCVSYKYDAIKLEEIDVPEALDLGEMLQKI